MSIDHTPTCVKAVLGKPGKYSFHGSGVLWFFEVDETGKVHQLKPATLQRDSVLSKEGWAEQAELGQVASLLFS